MGRQTFTAWSFVAFPLAVLMVFVLLPTVAGLVLGFFDWSGGPVWTSDAGWNLPRYIGLENFRRLLSEPTIGHGLRNTIVFTLVSVPLSVLVGFLLASAVNSEWFRGRTLVRTLLFMPTIVSIVAIAFVWRWMLDSDAGLLNWLLEISGAGWLLRLAGLETLPRWLVDDPWPFVWIVIIQIWRTVGFTMVLYLAALQGIPQSLYEAGSIDGASRWQSLRYITWPMVMPMTTFLLVTGVITALQVFDLVYIMSGRSVTDSTTVLNVEVYRQFTFGSYGYAAAIGMLIFVITMLATALQLLAARGRGANA